jgi:hypothetical protein
LCLEEDVELLNSHIVPKWAYRRLIERDDDGRKCDPVSISNGSSILTSSQIREYLLCGKCEKTLGRDEDYVARLAYQKDGRLGLLEMTTRLQLPNHKAGMTVDRLDCGSVIRFAASVLWRAHVSSRPECKDLRLSNLQAEALHKFLRNEAPLPCRFCFAMVVLMDGEAGSSTWKSLIVPPATSANDGVHQFFVCGLLFTFSTDHARLACLYCGAGRGILVARPGQVKFIRSVLDNVQTATPKGKLARKR